MRQWWDKPVRISLDGRTAINVNSNEAAAELLLGAWPGRRSRRHLYARWMSWGVEDGSVRGCQTGPPPQSTAAALGLWAT